MTKILLGWLATLAFILLTVGAAPVQAADAANPTPTTSSVSTPAPSAESTDAALAEAVRRSLADYRLGPDDKVRVIVFGEDSLTGEFSVGSSGKISLPLIGDVQASGLTVRQFQSEVETALMNGYLKDPKVSVEVTAYRPFYILGEVNKPGLYPYTNGLTVLNAVATAGGFTYRANTKKVYLKRQNGQKEQEYPLTSSTPMAPGDTIRIGERFF